MEIEKITKEDLKVFEKVLNFIREEQKEYFNNLKEFQNHKIDLCILEWVGIGEGQEWEVLEYGRYKEFMEVLKVLISDQ